MEPHRMSINKEINAKLLDASAYLNGYSPYIPWSGAIGLKPHLIKYTERHYSPLLAEEYLLNSYYIRGDMESELSVAHFYEDASLVTQAFNHYRDDVDLPKIALPKGLALDSSLGAAIRGRRSSTQFTGEAVSMDYLATIARCARGVSDTAITSLQAGGEISLDFSTVSSAGHLYPVDVYFMALNIKELDQGIYYYLAHQDVLIKTGNAQQLTDVLATFVITQNAIIHARSNYICLFVAHPWKSMSKYGNRGLRFILQEVGAITQNIHLANVCLGLGSVDWGGYYENEVNQIMGFDGISQSVLHMVLAGITA